MENNEKFGNVKIADSVILSIAGFAATDVKGVASLAGGISHDEVTRASQAQLMRCVKLAKSEEGLALSIAVTVNGDAAIPQVSLSIQKKVKNAIETMTGNNVVSVSVVVSEVSL